MFEEVFRKVGSVIHCTFIPIVYAKQSQLEDVSSDNDSVWNRLKAITHTNEYHALSPEMQSMINYTQNGIMFGGFVGASIFSKNQYVDFLKNERASQFKWHWEAKRELTNRLTRDAIRGALLWGGKSTIVATTFGVLLNLIPVIRNENSWPEFFVSGVVAGALAGHLFNSNRELGFQVKTYNGRFPYKTLCLMRGIGFGLLAGTAVGIYHWQSSGRSLIAELKKWEKSWQQRQKEGEITAKTD